MNNTTYKRQYREMPDATKKKISQRLRGRSLSSTHAENISKGMVEYWKTVPSKNDPTNQTAPDATDQD